MLAEDAGLLGQGPKVAPRAAYSLLLSSGRLSPAPCLTMVLPASTRVRVALTLALRTRPPSYATPFDGGLRGSR